jgi:hypothetical protein
MSSISLKDVLARIRSLIHGPVPSPTLLVSGMLPPDKKYVARMVEVISDLSPWIVFLSSQAFRSVNTGKAMNHVTDVLSSWVAVFLKTIGAKAVITKLSRNRNTASQCKTAKLIIRVDQEPTPCFIKCLSFAKPSLDSSLLNEVCVQRALNIISSFSKSFAVLHDAFVCSVDSENRLLLKLPSCKNTDDEDSCHPAITSDSHLHVCAEPAPNAHSVMISYEVKDSVSTYQALSEWDLDKVRTVLMPAIDDAFGQLCTLGTKYGFVHNDLHPGNILVSSTGQCTIIDFGRSTFLHEHELWAKNDPTSYAILSKILVHEQLKLDIDNLQAAAIDSCVEVSQELALRRLSRSFADLHLRLQGGKAWSVVASTTTVPLHMAPLYFYWDIGRFSIDALGTLCRRGDVQDDTDLNLLRTAFAPSRTSIPYTPSCFATMEQAIPVVSELCAKNSPYAPIARGLLFIAMLAEQSEFHVTRMQELEDLEPEPEHVLEAAWQHEEQVDDEPTEQEEKDTRVYIWNMVMDSYSAENLILDRVNDMLDHMVSDPKWMKLMLPWLQKPTKNSRGGSGLSSSRRQQELAAVWADLADPSHSANVRYVDDFHGYDSRLFSLHNAYMSGVVGPRPEDMHTGSKYNTIRTGRNVEAARVDAISFRNGIHASIGGSKNRNKRKTKK